MVKNTYYIRDNLIFSSNQTDVEYIFIDETIENNFDKKNLIDSNSKILKKLNEIKKLKKTIMIKGIVDDYKQIKEKIENSNKENIQGAKEGDYKFIEITSSIEILNQFLKEIKNNTKFKVFKSDVFEYLKLTTKPFIDKKIKIEKTLENVKNSLEEITNEYDKFKKENLEPITKQIQELTEKEKKLEEEKENLNINNSNPKIDKINKQNNKIQFKNKKTINKIEKLEFEIQILKEQIKIYEEKINLGINKSANPILLILTLGLSYWTKSSDIKYKIVNAHIEIANKKEKKLNLNLKLNKLKNETIKNSEKIEKQNETNQEKQKEKINKQNEIEDDIAKTQNEILNLKLQIEEQKPKENKILEKIDKIAQLENDTKFEYNLLEKNSPKIIREKIKELEDTFKKELENIQEIKNQIQNQKTTIDGEKIIQIE